MKLIKGVVELDLGLVLSLEKLHVVDKKNVGAAIPIAELVCVVVTHGSHELGRELLCGDTDHGQVGANGLLSYGV